MSGKAATGPTERARAPCGSVLRRACTLVVVNGRSAVRSAILNQLASTKGKQWGRAGRVPVPYSGPTLGPGSAPLLGLRAVGRSGMLLLGRGAIRWAQHNLILNSTRRLRLLNCHVRPARVSQRAARGRYCSASAVEGAQVFRRGCTWMLKRLWIVECMQRCCSLLPNSRSWMKSHSLGALLLSDPSTQAAACSPLCC